MKAAPKRVTKLSDCISAWVTEVPWLEAEDWDWEPMISV